MAITYQLTSGELCSFDPSDGRGPWTFETPVNPENGDWFTINATTFHPEIVTLKIPDGASERLFDPNWNDGNAALLVSGSMLGDAMTMYFAEDLGTNGGWFVSWTTADEPHTAVLSGGADNINPGTGFTPFLNYGSAAESQLFEQFGNVNQATGEITLPRDGVYAVNAGVVLLQGNTNKELACILHLDSSVGGTSELDAIQISDDKTSIRGLGQSFHVPFVKGEVIRLGLSRVNQTMGSCPVTGITFSVTYQNSNSLFYEA